MFASAMPESLMVRMGKLHQGRRLPIKTRQELLATIRPTQRRFIRADTGDLPEDWTRLAGAHTDRTIPLSIVRDSRLAACD
jgi:hypothetical protein